MREGKGEPMDMNVLAPAGIALFFALLMLIVPRFKPQRSRAVGITQAVAEINFALKEGQTIVGVMDTKKSMRFYIGTDLIDQKDYE
jgi:hypothetical protein